LEITTILMGLTLVFGLYMAWGIGANDVANAMATSVGSGALTLGTAIVIAAVFEFLGAFLAGGEVTSTIRKGIIDSHLLVDEPNKLVVGMLASLLAAAVWLSIASNKGWPVSTTHSIVGAIVGFAVVSIGVDAVYWNKVGSIAASWVLSPVLAGALSCLLCMTVHKLVLSHDDANERARKYIPVYVFVTAFVLAVLTVFKGLKHVGLDLSIEAALAGAAFFALVVAYISRLVLLRIPAETEIAGDGRHSGIEKLFAVLMIVTACAMAFAHGSNDVANAIGPIAAIISILSTGEVMQSSTVPVWVLLLGSVGIVLGLVTFGVRVMATVGKKITELTPSRGFAAELSAASVVALASGTGLPISTTHTLVGAVFGIGLYRGLGTLNFGVVRTIFLSWIITLPVGAALAIIFYKILWALLF